MAPPKHPCVKKLKSKDGTISRKVKMFWFKYVNKETAYKLVFDPNYLCFFASILLILEVFICILVIDRVKYTEIDWIAYMQEVEGFVNGTFDYTKLKGDTGPLVYPAGFVYMFTGLYYATNHGANIQCGQYIFTLFYITTLALVFRLLHKSKKLPPYALVFVCCTSYRIHSIFILRLFNDPVAMMMLFAALNLFVDSRWYFGSLMFSLAVSVKMNVLLFAPALLLAYLHCLGLKGTIVQLCICAAVQFLLAMPFLIANPIGYLSRSFDIGRVFLFEWTVNWRFLSEEVFVSREFHATLLLLHVALLALFAYTHWNKFLANYVTFAGKGLDISCQLFLLPMFTSNLIGVAVCRSLHYQFYVWYFYSLPYLLWCTKLPVMMRILILGTIELCWNTFPSTCWSSALLHLCHVVLLFALFHNRPSEQKIQTLKNAFKKKE